MVNVYSQKFKTLGPSMLFSDFILLCLPSRIFRLKEILLDLILNIFHTVVAIHGLGSTNLTRPYPQYSRVHLPLHVVAPLWYDLGYCSWIFVVIKAAEKTHLLACRTDAVAGLDLNLSTLKI